MADREAPEGERTPTAQTAPHQKEKRSFKERVDGLSTPAKIGIALGVPIGLTLLGIAIWQIVIHIKGGSSTTPDTGTSTSTSTTTTTSTSTSTSTSTTTNPATSSSPPVVSPGTNGTPSGGTPSGGSPAVTPDGTPAGTPGTNPTPAVPPGTPCTGNGLARTDAAPTWGLPPPGDIPDCTGVVTEIVPGGKRTKGGFAAVNYGSDPGVMVGGKFVPAPGALGFKYDAQSGVLPPSAPSEEEIAASNKSWDGFMGEPKRPIMTYNCDQVVRDTNVQTFTRNFISSIAVRTGNGFDAFRARCKFSPEDPPWAGNPKGGVEWESSSGKWARADGTENGFRGIEIQRRGDADRVRVYVNNNADSATTAGVPAYSDWRGGDYGGTRVQSLCSAGSRIVRIDAVWCSGCQGPKMDAVKIYCRPNICFDLAYNCRPCVGGENTPCGLGIATDWLAPKHLPQPDGVVPPEKQSYGDAGK